MVKKIRLPVKEMQETGDPSLSRNIPTVRKWQPIPVFLPGKSHGLRSLAGYTPWSRKESDRTEHREHLYFSLSLVLIPVTSSTENNFLK